MEVMDLRRPHTFGPTKMDVKVYGTLVSVVRVVPTLITPVMNIYDAFNQRLLRVKGPMSWQGCGNFDKRWGGFLKEAFTEADNFVITFPRVLDVRIKAAILGTCFLIVMSLRRPYTFGPDKMDVKINGSLVSVVRVEPTFMKPVLNINDADDKRVLRVKGPMCQDGEVDYEIFDKNKTRIGCIQKQWSGIAREVFTDADNFMITFPGDLDVRFKAAVIGTCLLILHGQPYLFFVRSATYNIVIKNPV
ncbi:hypothetical protein K1T71_002213 [Dendrolimus kikuchii]|uniref:Uncharacterized protein n=1 Tax=Dendrolimus kikuchii TaxID=765133 RepID=A0ACC1DGF1_9NEOP|nr:hypothetical protein K1T71_002213 [Dendrolimus kikuchii]